MFNAQPPSSAGNSNTQALQACIQIALAEGGAIARRWVQGLVAELRVREGDAHSYSDKTNITLASRELVAQRDRLETSFVAQWETAIDQAIKGAAAGHVSTARRSLSQIRFDELELMDDDQVQATVEIARVQQAVQAASEQALGDLSARLSRAQGFGVVRTDQNPLRPEVVIQALNMTLQEVCKKPATRGLWLQHGSKVLAAELDALYRYLRRVLDEHGIAPAEYVVAQPAKPVSGASGARGSAASSAAKAGKSASTVAPRPISQSPVFDDLDEDAIPSAGVPDFRPSSLLTLNHLHRLMVSGHAMAPVAGADLARMPQAAKATLRPGPGENRVAAARDQDAFAPTALSPLGSDGDATDPEQAEVPLPTIYMGAERRRRTRTGQIKDSIDPNEAGQLAELAEEVVGMMLDGIYRDKRLLPPVRDALQRLRPLFLRIAKHNPRFFADKQNPARQLLDEMTQQSLAFSSVHSQGFDVYLKSLNKVVESLVQADGHGTARLSQALEALRADVDTVEPEVRKQAQRRAVAALLQAEQRFLLAEKVAEEMQARKDYARAPVFMQQFLTGPWAQVIAWARLTRPASGPDAADGRLSAEDRYTSLIRTLLWSCQPEAASRSRSRLVSSIPVMLRNLREGLQTIEYPQEKSCDFFNQLMVLHETALKIATSSNAASLAGTASAAEPPAAAVEPAVSEPVSEAYSSRAGELAPRVQADIWVSPTETKDTGFMEMADVQMHAEVESQPDFADTVPVPMPDMLSQELDTAPETISVADLTVGSWIEWLQPSGEWQRAKLSWASPQGTMYLFIVAGGKSMSMTRRSFEAMCQRQTVRMISSQSMVDDALDGVMNAAVRNSTGRAAD